MKGITMIPFEYDQYLFQSMRNLHEITHLDIVRYDSEFNEISKISANPLPLPIGFTKDDYKAITMSLCEKEANCYCLATTNMFLTYLMIPIYYAKQFEGFLEVGPYTTVIIDDYLLSKKIAHNNYPLRYRAILNNYFSSLSIFSDEQEINMGYIGYNLINTKSALLDALYYGSSETTFPKNTIEIDIAKQSLIEERYAIEKQITHAIEIGSKPHLDEAIKNSVGKFNFKDRVPGNPLRSSKNLAFVSNSLCRFAAEKGGLHPGYLHSLSNKYAILIEKATTRSEVDRINMTMLYDYVDAVNEHAFTNLSPAVRKVVNYIQFHLADELTPSTLAEIFSMQASNLSNKFKKELNETITEFVKHLRIKEACYYLKYTDLPIKEISLLIGYYDQNYFSKVFREEIKSTPTMYRNQHYA